MTCTPYTYFEKDESGISYCSDTDFVYSIKIGHKCMVTVDEGCTDWIAGIVSDIKDNSFVLDTNNNKKVLICCEDIYDIHGEEELIESKLHLNPKWIMLSEAHSKEIKYLLEISNETSRKEVVMANTNKFRKVTGLLIEYVILIACAVMILNAFGSVFYDFAYNYDCLCKGLKVELFRTFSIFDWISFVVLVIYFFLGFYFIKHNGLAED